MELNDNWFSDMIPSTIHEYIDLRFVGAASSYMTPQSAFPFLAQVNFLIDDQTTYYTRQVNTLSGIFGEIGGLMGIITMITGLILGWVQE